MRRGFTHFFYAERYVERFTLTPCSEKLVTTHNVSLRTREDLGHHCTGNSVTHTRVYRTQLKASPKRSRQRKGHGALALYVPRQ